ncbi:Hypothetical protein CAP_8110 [Chondromyces apiculatus DSM 436]|uniref:Uncharacterized protein n=1 Tax=Chondromyces apiculatus DSM 436 TaxID=1192034 RepID=A0A017TEF9_9BACT|nr:Hypothetical protein CAP_8110 [Chondromyces apiculatus DSM 436]
MCEVRAGVLQWLHGAQVSAGGKVAEVAEVAEVEEAQG